MKIILIAAFAFGTIFDVLMSFFGLDIIVQANDGISLAVCAMFALALFAPRLCTNWIWNTDGFIFFGLRIWLAMTFAIEMFVAAYSVAARLIVKEPFVRLTLDGWSELFHKTPWPTLIICLLIVCYLVGSPIFLSHLWTGRTQTNERWLGRFFRRKTSQAKEGPAQPAATFIR